MFKKYSKIRFFSINIFITLLLIVSMEGVASFFLAARGSHHKNPSVYFAEQKHTRFDPLLGWINQANVHIENMYGDGVYLKTNSQSFRNEKDILPQKEKNKKRIICAGDSFTLGYGVSNNQTWCNLLSQNNAQFETVNMGQGGYGIDQAYLWYKRDGTKMQHDLLLFAFITADFYRMQQNDFHGYSKPFLTLENDMIRVDTPVKRANEKNNNSSAKWSTFLQNLKITEFIQKLKWKLKLWGSIDGVLSPEASKISEAILNDLKEITKKHNAKLLLVHLPNADDYPINQNTDALRNTLYKLSQKLDIPYVDLVQSINNLPSSFDAQMLFQFGNKHYSLKGNQFVAKILESKIEEILQIN